MPAYWVARSKAATRRASGSLAGGGPLAVGSIRLANTRLASSLEFGWSVSGSLDTRQTIDDFSGSPESEILARIDTAFKTWAYLGY